MYSILITGGAGFIGSNFARYIYKKYPDWKILILDLLTYAGNLNNIKELLDDTKRVEFWYGDVVDMDLVSDLAKRSDYVVHFAAETHVARSLYSDRRFFTTDVLGTQSVCNAVYKAGSKIKLFVHISTSEVYGTAEYEPMSEEHPLNPTSPYASAKAGADRLVYSYVKCYGIPAVILRPFNNYGPYQHLEKVIPRFITSAILKEKLSIHGDGSAKRDWIYVEDTAKIIEKILELPPSQIKGKVFNIGTGRSISVKEIAKKVLSYFSLEENKYVEYIPERFGQVQNHIADISKLQAIIDLPSLTSFEEGLEKTIKWYEKNRWWWEKQRWMSRVPIRTREGQIVWY